MATKKKEDAVIIIPELKLKNVILRIVGDSPLIIHAWDEKSQLMILDKQQKKATVAKEIRCIGLLKNRI